MSIFQLCGSVIVALILYLILKNVHERFSVMVLIAGSLAVLLFILKELPEIFGFADLLANYAKVSKNSFQGVLKGLAVCYIGEFTAGACKDFGVHGWAEKIELACRCALILIALPLFREFIDLLTELLK